MTLTSVAQLARCLPTKWKVTSSIPSQGTCLGCGFSIQLGGAQEATDPCFSHRCFSPSLSPSLLLSLKSKFKKLKQEKICVKSSDQFATASSRYTKVVDSVPGQGTDENQPMGASLSGTTDGCFSLKSINKFFFKKELWIDGTAVEPSARVGTPSAPRGRREGTPRSQQHTQVLPLCHVCAQDAGVQPLGDSGQVVTVVAFGEN